MKLFLTSAYPYNAETNFAVQWLKESARLDPYKIHSLCDNPKSADIILFVEHHPDNDPYFFKVFNSPLYKKYREKCFLYHDRDWVIPLLRGIFPSIGRNLFARNRTASGHYIARICRNEAIRYEPEEIPHEYLFSFVGSSATHHVRKEILNIDHISCYLKDTSGKNSWMLNPKEKLMFEKSYADIMKKSLFIICPRGFGPSTYRLFESMEMGRAPVIISDDWVPIDGPAWQEFSIHLPEEKIDQLPKILEKKKGEAREMGCKARLAWENWFSKEVSFHRFAETLNRLQQNEVKRMSFKNWIIYLQFLHPFHFRNLLRYRKQVDFTRKN
ncbi:exostosin domain-containing protein [Autumnicola psychrophila]|uniref:Exostosin family protein n=1 Tax=Autumnicola psychrophila TaxID=3075592 RepID=A0ABU3DQS2_9FLAO|nr:exostosin family protein [Zunongwangia sp. F225]MDT0686066.1 exostosin family protein [Zunongwangia sp. F225]